MTRTTASARQDQGWTVAALCAALALAVIALYWQTRDFEFISLDDQFVLVQRPLVSNGLSWAGLSWAISATDPEWYPVTWLSHMACFSLFGMDAGGHHLVNAGLHAATAVLLLLALRALGGALWPSALVAALFAVHPLRAESVAWVVDRKDLTSGLFWMCTLLAYASYARRPSPARYVLVAVAFGLGLMSKAMTVSLPVVLLLLDIWPLARWRPGAAAATKRPGPASASLTQLAVEKVPLFAMTLVVGALSVFTMSGAGAVRSLDQVSTGWRLVNPPIGYAAYIVQTLWPSGLAVMYPHPAYLAGVQVGDYVASAVIATVVLAAITAACVALVRTRPYLLVGWLWYLVTLLPLTGFLAAGRQWHADRYSYLPTIGLYVMIAWTLADAVARWPRLRVPAGAAAVSALAVLAWLSLYQISTWRDSQRVFEHAVAVTDNNYFAHQSLGASLRAQGDLAGARRHFEEALRISPDSAYALEQLGLLLEQQGDRAGAAAAYERAVALSWKSFYARRQLAALRRSEGRLDDAIALWTEELKYSPRDAQLSFDLGTALLQRERFAEAAVHLRHSVELWPQSDEGYNNLGVALARQGDFAAAAASFERVLALNPGHSMAAKSLAWVREQQQRGTR